MASTKESGLANLAKHGGTSLITGILVFGLFGHLLAGPTGRYLGGGLGLGVSSIAGTLPARWKAGR